MPAFRTTAGGNNESLSEKSFDSQLSAGRVGGTSVAASIVTGIAALAWSEAPDLSPGEIRQLIENSADKIDHNFAGWENGRSRLYGAGRVNAARLLSRVLSLRAATRLQDLSGQHHPVTADRQRLRDQIIRHEGVRTRVYYDSEGYATIGVGFNLQREDAKETFDSLQLNYDDILAGNKEMDETAIELLLDADIDTAIRNCADIFPNFRKLSDIRQRVLVDMMFNLGRTRIEGFRKMIAAVNHGYFARAADEMKDSKWYAQVNQRAQTLEAMMRYNAEP